MRAAHVTHCHSCARWRPASVKKSTSPPWTEEPLFDPGPESPIEVKTKEQNRPVWSENKAQLIARYLRFFVFVTHHGTYIDVFAGPQTERSEEAWTVQQVLASEPKWLRHFHLFDDSPTQVRHLQRLASENSDRIVKVHPGDSNRTLPSVLPVGSIREREATFCLLDQRTFECEWQLCHHISQLRAGETKVEQFYFLANDWLPRAFAGISTPEGEERVAAWLGDCNWRPFAQLSSFRRLETFMNKFKRELGYQSVQAWPIYERNAGRGKIMYYMIHATDHPEAPKLMARAYSQAVRPQDPVDQLMFNLNGFGL